jgi:hypothetical protein
MARLRTAARPVRHIKERPLKFLYSYWRYASHDIGLAPVDKMRPELLTVAFPSVAFIDREPFNGRHIRVRAAGRDAIRLKGREAASEKVIGSAMASGKPSYQRVTGRRGGRKVAYSRLILPLSSNGCCCDALLVATAEERPRAAAKN